MSVQRLSLDEIREAIEDYPGDALATKDHAEDFLAHLSKKVGCPYGHSFEVQVGGGSTDVHEPTRLSCTRCGRYWKIGTTS